MNCQAKFLPTLDAPTEIITNTVSCERTSSYKKYKRYIIIKLFIIDIILFLLYINII